MLEAISTERDSLFGFVFSQDDASAACPEEASGWTVWRSGASEWVKVADEGQSLHGHTKKKKLAMRRRKRACAGRVRVSACGAQMASLRTRTRWPFLIINLMMKYKTVPFRVPWATSDVKIILFRCGLAEPIGSSFHRPLG